VSIIGGIVMLVAILKFFGKNADNAVARPD